MLNAFQYFQGFLFNCECILLIGILKYSLIEWIFSEMEY